MAAVIHCGRLCGVLRDMISGRWVEENNLKISEEMTCDKVVYYFIMCKKLGKELSMSKLKDLEEKMNCWGFSVNARIAFDKFVKAIEKEEGITFEIQKIFNIIDEIVLNKEKDQFQKELPADKKLYRARIIDAADDDNPNKGIGKTADDRFLGYNDINSREPLIGISGAGRNNISGESYLYVASNPQTACMEIKSQFSDLISLATFELSQPLKIIDFASDDKKFQREDTEIYGLSLGVFFTLLMFRYMQPVRGENTYRVTQIVSDYLRKTGIDGISYNSFLSPGGINYTIFNCHHNRIKFCDSKVLIHRYANHSFWDFNEGCVIMSNENEDRMKWKDDEAEEYKKQLRDRFKNIE